VGEGKKKFIVLLPKICCEEQQVNICADLKVVAMPTVLQGGYNKLCCL
jgi:hypothetical protein